MQNSTQYPKPPHHIASLQRSCIKLGLEHQILDDYSGQLLQVHRSGKSFIFGSGNICAFPINSATSTFLVRDKSHTINVLRKAGIRCAEGEYFFTQDAFKSHRGPGREIQDAFEYVKSVGFPLFVKPNDGSRGSFVEKLFCSDDLHHYLEKRAAQIGCIRIEKPLKGDEYRLLVVDGKIWFGYKRKPPFLIFNGEDSVASHLYEVIRKQGETGHVSF